jgi:hypothetical protein
MAKISPLIPNDVVLRDFDKLSGSARLIPEQVSMIMGVSIRQLEKNRKAGHPLPYIKEGGKVLYRVEDVRNYLNSQPVYKDSAEAFAAKQKEDAARLLGIRRK